MASRPGDGAAETLTRIRERIARTDTDEVQLRAVLVLAHELLRGRASTAVPLAPEPGPAVAPLTAAEATGVDGYAALVAALHARVAAIVPHGSRVLVVSKGDEALLVPGYDGAHFPQGRDGVYAGHYPADSDAAVAHLEQCIAAGAEFLVFPATAYWWLEYYAGLAQHLLFRGRVAHHDHHCLIFALRPPCPQEEPTP